MSDADILHPDRVLTIGDKEVTVKELRFRDELDLGQSLVTIIAEIAGVIKDEHDLSGFCDAFYKHPAEYEAVLLKCTGEDSEWLDGLSAEDGHVLLMEVVGVNAKVFKERLGMRSAMAAAAQTSAKST